ncbi:MAG: DUF1223 domain-containing protein [Pseudolabrys sp.]
MHKRHIAFAAAILTIALTGSRADAEPRAVVELFTSQGCSSCPAADKLLGELANDPSLVTMTLAVNYWDYLGWKDTLALKGHAKRQRAYAEARGDREVYTPQAVINGKVHVLGSDKSAIERAIAQTRGSGALKLPVSIAVADGKVTVRVPAAVDEHRAGEVWLCPTTGKVVVAIGSGENTGRSVTYTNVVRRWVKLGDWNGEAKEFTLPIAKLAGEDMPDKIDNVTAVVQSGAAAKPGLMLGAASATLP